MAEERLQKILARAGVASRRGAERLIAEGRVTVNGKKITRLGTHADPERDHVKVDGRLLRFKQQVLRYFVAFKPRRMITSLVDPEGRPTVGDLLRSAKIRARVFPVGRLDWDTDGLLLLTNDGPLAQEVSHPRCHLPKTYRVKVRGCPDERALERLRRGIVLRPGVRTRPAEVRVEEHQQQTTWLRIVLREGRQNQIKLMCEKVGHPVRRLRRTGIGPLTLGRLRLGEVRPLGDRDLQRLRRALERGGEDGRPRRPRTRKSGRRA